MAEDPKATAVTDLAKLEKELTADPQAKPAQENKTLVPKIFGVSSALVRSKAGSLIGQLPQMFGSLGSSDQPTRRMAWVFVWSLLGLIAVSGIAFKRYSDLRKAERLNTSAKRAKKINELIKKQTQDSEQKASTLSLGSFTVQVKSDVGPTSNGRVFDMAELEIVLQCDNPATRDYLNEHMVETRDQLSDLFVAMNREDLLTREGKKRLRTSIIKKINAWYTAGKVEDLFFSKVLIN